MKNLAEQFNKYAEKKAFDAEHRRILNHNLGVYEKKYEKIISAFRDLESSREKAAKIRHHVVENLERYLIDFEHHFNENGGHVVWALDKEDATDKILNLLHENDVKSLVKSKSMATEEINLNEILEKEGIESLETDLGEFIVQLQGEKPYHITAPALHQSREKVSNLYHEQFGLQEESSAEEITEFTRNKLRDKFKEADAGITGANFLLAEEGGIAITENEGNGLLSYSFPDLHIVVAGIDKVIPSFKDLELFWTLLSSHGTGQKITAYNSVITSPGKDPQRKMVVVLIDNGRTNLLAKPAQREALACIRCGACMNVCPVYRNIGGHAYGSVYNGPIGSVIIPHMEGMDEFGHLSFASTLCGKCNEVCPVKIDITRLLLLNRKDATEQKLTGKYDSLGISLYKKVMQKRSLLEMVPVSFKKKGIKLFFKNSWGKRRAFPEFSNKSFNHQWKNKQV